MDQHITDGDAISQKEILDLAKEQLALEEKRKKYAVSPFKTYRREILSDYSTAQRLAALTLHLWNDQYPVRLGSLFWNADDNHTRIALELMESYSIRGENDPDFMALGREIYERDIAPKSSNED